MQGDRLSHGLWEATAPPAPPAPPLRGRVEVDVAVIGAGYTGLSAALHLAEAGRSVAVLEAAEVGFGASGRNVGLVNAGMWVLPEVLPRRLGEVRGARLLRLLGDAPSLVFELVARHGMPCEASRQGTLHCAVGAPGLAGLRKRAAQWQRLQAPVELLSRDETAIRVGTGAYAGALLDRRAGTIQPLAYARGLARAALAAGAALHGGSPVTGAQDRGGAWRLAIEGGGQVDARWVVVATNTYTRPGGPWSSLAAELVRMPYFNLATRPLPADLRRAILPGGEGAWDTRAVLSSLRLDGAGRLVFGSIGALRPPAHGTHLRWGRRALLRLFPALEDVTFEHEWYGWIGMTADALPRFHALARNVVSFSGYNGRGIGTGTVFGRELARLVLGEIGAADLALPERTIVRAPLRAARELFYEAGAQVAHAVDARWGGGR